MNFELVIRKVVGDLEAAKLRYALIGGFAMALRGVQRTTVDLDFILVLEDLPRADAILRACGYERAFHSENVSHYISQDGSWGRIDILHAFRLPSLSMLQRAEKLAAFGDLAIRVVHIEDLIGLKIQAAVNDPKRAAHDWEDIRLLLESAKEQNQQIDWTLLRDYLAIFQLEDKLPELKAHYGSA